MSPISASGPTARPASRASVRGYRESWAREPACFAAATPSKSPRPNAGRLCSTNWPPDCEARVTFRRMTICFASPRATARLNSPSFVTGGRSSRGPKIWQRPAPLIRATSAADKARNGLRTSHPGVLFDEARQRLRHDLLGPVEADADLIPAVSTGRDLALASQLGDSAERHAARFVIEGQVDAVPPLGVHGRPDDVGVLAAEVNNLLVAPVDVRLRHRRLQ